MAQTRRRHVRQERRHNSFLKRVLLIFVAVAAAAVVLWLVVVNFSKASDSMMRNVYKLEYTGAIEKAAQEYDLDKALICGVIHTESGFDPDAGSGAGAQGLMQLMPSTFEWLAQLRGETVPEYSYTDPELNIDYGCYFLRWLFDRYGDTEVALAAYNAGFGAVDEWLKDKNCSPDGKTLTTIPVTETANYVPKVLKAKDKYNELYF